MAIVKLVKAIINEYDCSKPITYQTNAYFLAFIILWKCHFFADPKGKSEMNR